MEKLHAVLLAAAGLFVVCCGGATTDEHYGNCQKEWLLNGPSCFQFNSTRVTFDRAIDACRSLGAKIVNIENQNENDVLKETVIDANSWNTWIGAQYSYYDRGWRWVATRRSGSRRMYFTKWKRHNYHSDYLEEHSCAIMNKKGYWEPYQCDLHLPFFCQKSANCEDGWYGPRCSYRCHCFQNEACPRSGGLCPRGCSRGWDGPSCSEKNAAPDSSYHCLRTSNDSLRAQVTVTHGDKQYPLVRAVGQDAKPLACSGDRMSVERLPDSALIVNLYLPGAFKSGNVTAADDVGGNVTSKDHVSGNDTVSGNVTFAEFLDVAKRDDCIASWSTNGTVTWLVEFSRYEGLTIDDDVTVEVSCDLNDAIDMKDENLLADDSHVDHALDPEATPLNITVVLIDVHSGKEMERLHLGQELQLQVQVEGLNSYECPYPHSCVARASDGSSEDEGVKLVDEKGCPAAGSPVHSFEVSPSVLTSNSFPAFTLGSKSVDIDCQVDVVHRMTVSEDCPAPSCV